MCLPLSCVYTDPMSRRNPHWQAYYDSKWYFYFTYGDGTKDKTTRSGIKNARATAKALTYNPKIVSLTLYTSKRSVANGVQAKFVWTRKDGWK